MGALAKQLGKDIRRCRKASKITLEELELVTGITRKTLIRLEKGEDVRFSTVEKVLLALGITVTAKVPEPISASGGDDEWF